MNFDFSDDAHITRRGAKPAADTQRIIETLHTAGLTFRLDGDTAIFRVPSRATVEYYINRSRWKVRGQKKTTHGSVKEFVNWFTKEFNIDREDV
jgi:hypothetical protein